MTYRVCRGPFARARYCVVALLVCIASCVLTAERSLAQDAVRNLLTFPKRPVQPKPPTPASDGPMLVQASEIKYDYTNNTVSAVGSVQAYYGGATIEADDFYIYNFPGSMEISSIFRPTVKYDEGVVTELEMPSNTFWADAEASLTPEQYAAAEADPRYRAELWEE